MDFDHSRHEMHRHQVHHEAEDKPIAFNFTSISVSGATTFLEATAINNHGVVVGDYGDNNSNAHAFIYNHGIVTTIDPPGSNSVIARGINDFGEVVGMYSNNNGDTLGFTYQNGVFTTIDLPVARITNNLVINNHGEVAGYYFDGSGEHGFIYDSDSGAATPLGVPGATQTFPLAINNHGEIAGNYLLGGSLSQGGSQHGFVYDNGTFTTIDPPGALSTQVNGINDQGDIVGLYQISEGNSTAFFSFLYHDGTFTNVGVPGALTSVQLDDGRVVVTGDGTDPVAINNRGEIVGEYTGSDDKVHGFVYDKGTFTTVDKPSADETFPVAINDRGEVVGGFLANDSNFSQIFIARPSGKPDRLEMNFPTPGAGAEHSSESWHPEQHIWDDMLHSH